MSLSTHVALLITVAVTTVCWVATAFLGPQTDRAKLIAFYEHVRPAGPGWAPIRKLANPAKAYSPDDIPMSLLGWVAGCMTIWSALFTVGNLLYGRTGAAVTMLVVFVVSGSALLFVIRKLWSTQA
jgi:hypothetical protein